MRGRIASCRGQSTVEFAIVMAAFLAVALGLSALWHAADRGLLVQHALQSASHHLQGIDLGAWCDVLAY
jgi:Flp pilus assembly protein TadG